jgi:hypothetical protein
MPLLFNKLIAADEMIWPLDSQPALTASFGEYRDNHFHAGVDLKTWGRIGDPCFAVGDGWVTRIKTSPVGYGRALYLKLDDGRTAVYAHLSRYGEAVEDIIHHVQLKQRSYSVELFLDNDAQIRYHKGDVVGYSGQSGTSHPHLHFEIRDSAEQPANPLLEGLEVTDHSLPVPTGLALTPLDALSTVEDDPQPRIYNRLTQMHSGLWSAGDPIGVSGRIGIAVEAYDKADAAENQLAAAWLELKVNGERRWITRFDRFSLLETRKIFLERDYRLLRREWGSFDRLYRMPGNDLPMCQGEGIINAGDFDQYPIEVEIILGDVAGNESHLAFTLVDDHQPDENRLLGGEAMVKFTGSGNGGGERIRCTMFDNYLRLAAPPGITGFQLDDDQNILLPAKSTDGGAVAAWAPPVDFSGTLQIGIVSVAGLVIDTQTIQLQTLIPDKAGKAKSADDVMEVFIGRDALYDTTWIMISPDSSLVVPGEVEAVYRVEPRDQPLAGEVTVSLRIPGEIREQPGWGVYYFANKRGWTFLGHEQHGQVLSAKSDDWEIFGLVRDTVPPAINNASLGDGDTLRTATPRFAFSVNDEMSGVNMNALQMTLDADTIPAEFDSPRARFFFQPWWKLARGDHILRITASDRIGNSSERVIHFTILER